MCGERNWHFQPVAKSPPDGKGKPRKRPEGHSRPPGRVIGAGLRRPALFFLFLEPLGGHHRAVVHGLVLQVLLDAQELVVLGQAVRAAQGAGLDLAGVHGHGQIGDEGVLGLARAVGDHRGVGRLLGHLDGVQGLGQGADLVQLDEDGVGHALVDAFGQDLGVGDEDVVAHQLDGVAQGVGQLLPAVQSPSARPSSMEMSGYFLVRAA